MDVDAYRFRSELLRIRRRALDQIAELETFATELLATYEKLNAADAVAHWITVLLPDGGPAQLHAELEELEAWAVGGHLAKSVGGVIQLTDAGLWVVRTRGAAMVYPATPTAPAPGRETMPFADGGVVRGPGPNREESKAAEERAAVEHLTGRANHEKDTSRGVHAPAVGCSCPRYPGGGRQSTDPQCALHSGDPRD